MGGIRCLALLLVGWLRIFVSALSTPNENYVGMQTFLTRPDIECASWKVTVYDEEALAPGYWFVAPYEKNGYKKPGGSWIGPHIYDGKGELVWSGSHMFNRINVMDFGVMNVAGEDLLSMSYAVEGQGYILDNRYQVKQTVFEGVTGVSYNMHDFHTIEDGNKFLYLQRNITHASAEIAKEDLGYDGECSLTFPGFEERDVRTGEILFKWDATGKIPLSDSTMAFAPVEQRCTQGSWDYLHSNAIDKFPDGHYLLSTRHSDTIYKISKDDGSIIWRLHGHGGERSDFEMVNLNFSRQHDARFREHNGTHLIISFLDNAKGADPQRPTTPWSRGLLVALNENTMKAETIGRIDHPHQGHAFRRGSYQRLPNGNVFMGWSEQALQSEHTPDGRLLMEAELLEPRLGTYRAFKFPFVAEPDYLPDIYSNASSTGERTVTSVYASWNGATEVASWALYKTNGEGDHALITSVPRSGFETCIEHEGYAKYVFIQAKNRNGHILGNSAVIETLSASDLSTEAMAEELLWLREHGAQGLLDSMVTNWIAMFIGGIICGVVIAVLASFATTTDCRWWPLTRRTRYQQVPHEDNIEGEETNMDDLSPSRSYGDRAEDDGQKRPRGQRDQDDRLAP